MASLLLRLRSIFILTNLEVTRFISVLVRCNPWSQPPKLFFLRYFLVRYFKYLLENCFSETTMILFLKRSMWTTFPRFPVFPFTLTFSRRNCSKFPESKIPSSTGWVRSKLNFQVDFLGFLSFFYRKVNVSMALYNNLFTYKIKTLLSVQRCTMRLYMFEMAQNYTP